MSDIDLVAAAVEGRYRIERELGEGGMATVYLAEDLRHDRKVAVKVLRPELAAAVGADRFLNEIKLTANLSHPNILQLYDSGRATSPEGHEFLYFVMPYVTGETLRDRLDRETQLPIGEAVEIAKGVARALDHAHRQGILHRDIKPENILLQDGQPILADFGIALAAESVGESRMTESGVALGTPTYMSPEQASGEGEIGTASDLYALTCVLYEMLVGQPPHTGPTAVAIMASIVSEKPRPARSFRDTVPEGLDRVLERGLAKVPADRWRAAADFLAALDKSEDMSRSEPTSSFGRIARLGTLVGVSILLGLWLLPDRGPSESETIRRIAVVPLENLTGDPEQEYFAVGMTEAAITQLRQIGLEVLSRQSVMQFAGLPPAEIARQLNVDAILLGSVFRSEERMRLDMRFLDADDERQIWTRSFDTTMTASNVFDIQGSIATNIAEALQLELSPLIAERLTTPPTTDVVALNSVQLGSFKWMNANSTADYYEALDHFSAAIERDPLYAEAWNMRGAVRQFLVSIQVSESPSQDLHEAKSDLLRALELDSLNIVPNGASVSAHLAFALMHEWDFAGAEREFQRAVNQLGERAGGPYPLFMSMTGRHDEALERWASYEVTFDISVFLRINQLAALWWARRYEQGLELLPTLPPPLRALLGPRLLLRAGLVEQGLAALDSLYESPIPLSEGLNRQAGASTMLMAMEAQVARGETDEALRHFERFRLLFDDETQAPLLWAAAHAIMGDEDQALETLRRSLERHDPTLAWIGQAPEIDILRGHPEFHEIARAVGVPDPRLRN